MGSSYVSNHIHVVFSTKERVASITEELQPKLWAYMAGIARNHGMHAVSIGGIQDHIHVLINLGALLSIAEAVKVIKSNSSRWINNHPGPRFEWQDGYFACSVSRSHVAKVSRYIATQEEHHRKMDSATEFAMLLEKHGFQYQED
jgi:REP element-mobilizing transposase RayT